MYETYKIMKENGISPYTVKSDAFTINHKDLDKCKELINFGDTFGTWRVSKKHRN